MKRMLLAIAFIVSACGAEEVAIPEPRALTEDATSHFCRMVVTEHGGPKAQIHLHGLPDPYFFAQVRDALSYYKGPERAGLISAFYVSDMAVAESWDDPGAENWILAEQANYVIGADIAGGMGAPEVVPFGDPAAARAFADREGGQVVALADIPDEAVFAPIELDQPVEEGVQ